MIYILQGQEPYFIKEKIDEIVSASEGELYSFDGSDKELSIASLMEACEGNSLFSNGTIVLVDQPLKKKKKCDEKQLRELQDQEHSIKTRLKESEHKLQPYYQKKKNCEGHIENLIWKIRKYSRQEGNETKSPLTSEEEQQAF